MTPARAAAKETRKTSPIKSLAMIKRSLEKVFMCKSQFMIMIHSEWCLLLLTCLLWDRPAIYFGVRKGGGGAGGSNNRKTKSCTRKEGEKIGTQGSLGKRLCKSHLFLEFV